MHKDVKVLVPLLFRNLPKLYRRGLLVFAALLLFACASEPEYQSTLTPIVLESGVQVNSCHDYEQMRNVFRLQENVSNQLASAEYLPCSLAIGVTPDLTPEVTMRAIFHGLKVRAIPTSLGPSVSQDVSLSMAGFNLWLERSMLTFSDEQSNIQIQYKGQLKNKNHLVWVSDRTTQGNYVSYYPAIIMMQDGEILGAAPVYASGF